MWTSTGTRGSPPAAVQGGLRPCRQGRPPPCRPWFGGRRPAGGPAREPNGLGFARLSPARGTAGFTLLEVLVSLTILSVVLIALHQAYSSNIYVTSFNRSLWRAIVHSHNEIQRFERLPPPPVSIREGDFDQDDPMFGFHWEREVVDEMPIPGIRLRKVKLKISWVDGASTRSYRTETYVLPR